MTGVGGLDGVELVPAVDPDSGVVVVPARACCALVVGGGGLGLVVLVVAAEVGGEVLETGGHVDRRAVGVPLPGPLGRVELADLLLGLGSRVPGWPSVTQYLISYGGSAFDARHQNEIFPCFIIFRSSLLF